MLLTDNKELFSNLINEISMKKKIDPSYIEKDFFAISVLKELVSKNSHFVFKGGTSLSVCQRVIKRFSEDIDISYDNEKITCGQRKKIKQDFIVSIQSVGLQLANVDNIRSRRIFNRYICIYNSMIGFSDGQILVEWASQSPSFPNEFKEAQTIIGRYLSEIKREDLIVKYGLSAFNVKTQKLERTFVDKIFAICDYHISRKLTRQSRHIYDLYKILPLITLDESLLELFEEIRKYRYPQDTCYSAKDGIYLFNVLDQLIKEETYKDDYKMLTVPLLYEQVSYNECIESLKLIKIFLMKNNI